MYKKLVAVLVAMAMVLSSAMVAMASAPTENEFDNAVIKETLESILDQITDEEGSFEPETIRGLIGYLFGADEAEAEEDQAILEQEYASIDDFFTQIEEAIDLHLMEETADGLEAGDETVFSHFIASFDMHEDETIHVLGYFTIMNFDVDDDCPDDLLMKNGAGLTELLTLEPNEDGMYEVTECVPAEDGEGYSDSVELMCEDMGIDADEFYEAMALSDLTYVADLYEFMEAHPEYDHIEYMGELMTMDDLDATLDELFEAYLALYAIDATLTEAEAEDTEEDEAESTEAEQIASHALSTAIISAIIEAVENVDMEAKEAVIGDEFSEDGTVFSLLEDVLTDINDKRGEAEKEVSESLTQSLGILASLGEEELSEEDLDALLGLMLLELVAGEEEFDEESFLTDLAAADLFINFILDTAESNEVIAEAVEATDSSLFEILEQTLAVLGEYADEDGTMYVFSETGDTYFDEFEEELDKVEDYINTMEGPKQAALDVLALIRVITDEVQSAIYSQVPGESAEAVTTNTLQLGTSSYTLEIPESYEEGELSEEDVKNKMVVYMKSPRFKTDFDVYQYSKEGCPEDLAEHVQNEATKYNTTDIQTDVDVNGIKVARCEAIEPYQGKDYDTITYYLDDGDTYVEVVFWLWDDASGEQAETIFSTLAFAEGVTTFDSEETYENVFTYWDAQAPALNYLIEYVESVTDETSSDYIPVSSRIAVFDMDGTLIGELFPTYFVLCVFEWRVLKDPNYQPDEELFAFGIEGRDAISNQSYPENFDERFETMSARAYSGMTLNEYSDYITQLLLKEADGFQGMNYGEAFYLPMLEIIEYLQDNDFTIYICSGSDRFLCRTMLEGMIDIPYANIIGTDVVLEATGQNGEKGIDYIFSTEDDIIRTDKPLVYNESMNKVNQIVQEIGVQPVLAFGNSEGDVSMHNYILNNNPYKSAAFMLIADDEERDYGNTEYGQMMGKLWEDCGYQVISMKDDFLTIYGDDVVKTGKFRWAEDLETK